MGLFSIFKPKMLDGKCYRKKCSNPVKHEEGKAAWCSEACSDLSAEMRDSKRCSNGQCERVLGTPTRKEGSHKHISVGNLYYQVNGYVAFCSLACHEVNCPPPPPEMVEGTPEYARAQERFAREAEARRLEQERDPEGYEKRILRMIKAGRRVDTMQSVTSVSAKLTEVNRLRSEARKLDTDAAHWKKMGNDLKAQASLNDANEARALADTLEDEAKIDSEQSSKMNEALSVMGEKKTEEV